MSKGSSSSPKSPYVMSRISPKSPYILAAKSPKSPMIHEDYKSGCAWRLISIFNFRQGRPKKKLISDRRGPDKLDTDNRHTRSRPKALSGVDEKCLYVDDGPPNKTLLLEYTKKNVTGLREKDMPTEQKVKKKHVTESKPSLVSVKPKQASRQISVDELLHKLDSAAMTDSLQNHPKRDRDNDCEKKGTDCLDSNQLIQMNDLAKAYVNQKFINGEFLSGGGSSSQSKQFLDALQILNSNKDLFVKLLQDPNSLLAKQIEDLRGAQADEIVVLKPGPSQTRSYQDDRCSSLQYPYPGIEGHRSRPTSFTLEGFRRKLKHVIGVNKKEQHQYTTSNGTGRIKSENKDCSLWAQKESREIASLIDGKKPGYQKQICDSSPNSPENLLCDTKTHESLCSLTGSQRIVETTHSVHQEESNRLEVPSELENDNKANLCRDDESLESSTSSSEVSSSAVLYVQKVEDVNSTMEGAELPSPVSVLERFCIEDITSPANITSQSAVEPQQISFEEEDCSGLSSFHSDRQRTLSSCIDEHGSLADYVRAVVKAASLNWYELSLKCNLSDQILEPSIYDEFGVSCSDHGLLFDCINEILLRVYQSYFRCSPWVSFLKPNGRPFSLEEHVVCEVMNCFDCKLLLQPQSQTLVNLAKTDLAKSTTWMDVRIDAEVIVAEMAEGVLEELVMETVSQLRV